MNIPEELKKLMSERGFKQVQLVKLLNLKTQPAVHRRLNTLNPTVKSLTEVLDLLGYELVMQPRRAGRRIEGQIVLDGKDEQE